ncbi:MAG TPA: family 16 glycoside hydrolase [Nocardioides sp.]|nr:family 16 glycoside hydrolase [Nocardioides sp.]
MNQSVLDPCVATPPAEGWTSLFDGTFASFDGWRKAGAGGFGRQTDCTIRSIRGAGATWLTQQRTAPYTLDLDWRRNDSNDDSSVYLASSARVGVPTDGYRVRIGADDTGVIETVGGAQQLPDAAALGAAVHPVGEWNTYRIEVTTTSIKLRLNGVVVNALEAPVPAAGFIGLENRSFLDQVDFRAIQARVGVEPEVPDPVASTTSLTVLPGTVRVVTGTSTASVAVAATGATPAGDVEFWVGGVLRATVPVVDGKATAKVGPFTTVGTRSVQARYLGDATTLPSEAASKVVVAKATPSLAATVQAARIVARKTWAAVTIRVRATGYTPTGVVRVTVAGRSYAARLASGRAVIRVAPFRKAGTYRGVVAHGGDPRTLKASRYVTFRVARR